jgi:putative FmdB family regulatory protein
LRFPVLWTGNVNEVPIYEFDCAECGARFEELVAAGGTAPCPRCKSSDVARRLSQIAEPRVPVGLFGSAAQKSNSERSRREEKRREGWAKKRER